jgi:calcium-dependent protein kinase
LCGSPPFGGKSDEEIMKRVEKGQYSLTRDEFKDVSVDAKNLIKKMLEYDPNKRVSARQAISDPWFTNSLKKDKEGVVISQAALSNLKKLNVDYFYVVQIEASTGCLLLYRQPYDHQGRAK